MSEMNEGGAKTLSAKARGAVAEAIGGLFSDMFTAENNNSAPKEVQEEHGFGKTVGKAVGQGVGMMTQVASRMTMMQFMRQQSAAAGKSAGKPRAVDTASDFAATTGMDMDGDGMPDF